VFGSGVGFIVYGFVGFGWEVDAGSFNEALLEGPVEGVPQAAALSAESAKPGVDAGDGVGVFADEFDQLAPFPGGASRVAECFLPGSEFLKIGDASGALALEVVTFGFDLGDLRFEDRIVDGVHWRPSMKSRSS
jgi:hypothetical protein